MSIFRSKASKAYRSALEAREKDDYEGAVRILYEAREQGLRMGKRLEGKIDELLARTSSELTDMYIDSVDAVLSGAASGLTEPLILETRHSVSLARGYSRVAGRQDEVKEWAEQTMPRISRAEEAGWEPNRLEAMADFSVAITRADEGRMDEARRLFERGEQICSRWPAKSHNDTYLSRSREAASEMIG